MIRASSVITFWIILAVNFGGTLEAQTGRQRATTARGVSAASCSLNGVYRINPAESDKLYSVVEGITGKVPLGNEQKQKFLMDLSVRLTPPDVLAIECRGNRVTVGSSRAQPVTFVADGITRTQRSSDGSVVQSRIAFENDNLIFRSSGKVEDNVNVTFASHENGQGLRVTRHIYAAQLAEPIIIKTAYNKVSEVARWDIFGEGQGAGQNAKQDDVGASPAASRAGSAKAESDEAVSLRNALNQWIEATNRRDIEDQMTFYMPELKAFYLARNASRDSVRAEKARVFANAKSIDIRAEEPEIVFQDGGRTAVMRFRKKYNVADNQKRRSGVVIQELRWQQTNNGWRIFSERDVRVIR
ncbi:MAG: nuclear transport factor 2 family protein [Acidobacteriota bacterium]|nr:nuclear transport factor 2 family protein [Acidobacteriota bacterium]